MRILMPEYKPSEVETHVEIHDKYCNVMKRDKCDECDEKISHCCFGSRDGESTYFHSCDVCYKNIPRIYQ